MIECPKCNKLNSINNTKCFNCGSDLPSSTETSHNQTSWQFTENSTTYNSSNNSKKINNMAVAICIVGIILSIILGFVFQIATIKTGLYSTETTYSFNWLLCIGTIIGTVCLTIVLKAMSYIERAIEEK